jgi:flagellar M-ring protein FliF
MANAQNPASVGSFTEGFIALPAFRQLGVLFGFAAVAALGVALVLWTWTSNYDILFASLGEKESGEIAAVLKQRNIDFKIDPRTGAVLVPSSRVQEIRMQLAGEGLPKSSGMGLELLQQKQEYGTSQFMETTRYQHALETELARSIMTISSVENARVHLAMPKQSVFVRKRQQPSASVLVNLYAGRMLENGQVAAITHLVASSIPNLEPDRVTVVDEAGHLLSSKKSNADMAMNQDQFEYTRNLERNYIDRIEDILAPIVGIGGVRAQVSTLIDFTVTEQTSEAYNPDLPALRSEKVMEESSSSGGAAEGVPGALSNQPPANATAPETLFDANGQPVAASGPQNSRRSSTTNYELDRTISHTRMGGGNIKRLSIAVVVDDRTSINDQGEQVRESRSQGEMERITALVKEAVGYSAQRGDTLNVINAPFTQPEAIEAIPVEPIWEQAWAIDLAKTLGAVILGALLIFMVLRPMISNLAAVKPTASEMLPAGGGGGLAEDRLSIGGEPEGLIKLPSHGAYEDNIEMVKQVVNEDPKLVAQVVRNWIAEDK